MTRDELERELLAQPVRSLQYMLRRLSLQYPFLPEIVADGVFGERTHDVPHPHHSASLSRHPKPAPDASLREHLRCPEYAR